MGAKRKEYFVVMQNLAGGNRVGAARVTAVSREGAIKKALQVLAFDVSLYPAFKRSKRFKISNVNVVRKR